MSDGATLDRGVMPEPGHCACKFSSGGVLSKQCEFHTRLIASAVKAEREECANLCDLIATLEKDPHTHNEINRCARHIRARERVVP